MKLNSILTESWAVCLRELYRSSKLWKQILMIFLSLGMILLIGASIGKFVILPEGQEYSGFLSSGMIAYFICVASLGVGLDLVIDKDGFMRLLLVAPISRISILIGKLFYLLISFFKSYFIMGIFLLFYLNTFSIQRLFLIIFTFLMSTLIFLGIGFGVAAFIKNKLTAEKVFQYLVMIFLFFSGTFYPTSNLNSVFLIIYYINPMSYTTEAMRFCITGKSIMPVHIVFPVIFFLAMMCSIIGINLYDKYLRR